MVYTLMDLFRCRECAKMFSSMDMLSWVQKEVELESQAARMARVTIDRSAALLEHVSQLRELFSRCKSVLGCRHWATCAAAKALGQSLSYLPDYSLNLLLLKERQDALQMWIDFVQAALERYSPHAARVLVESVAE